MRLDISKSSLWCFFHLCSYLSWIPFNIKSPAICDFFSGVALLIWFFDFTDVLFSLSVATCFFFIAFILSLLSESFITFLPWELLDVILVELWFIEAPLVFSSQLFWLISLWIIVSLNFNSVYDMIFRF